MDRKKDKGHVEDDIPVIIDDGGSARILQLGQKMDGLANSGHEDKAHGTYDKANADNHIAFFKKNGDKISSVALGDIQSIAIVYSGESPTVAVKIGAKDKTKIKAHPKAAIVVDDLFGQRLYKVTNSDKVVAV